MRSLQYALSSSSLLLFSPFVSGLNLDLSNSQSIKSAAKTVVENVISIYNGGNGTSIPGIFPSPYYWWNAGLAFDSLVNYWALTGDDTYNDLVSQALLWQVGQNDNYMPTNQSASIGNDDQATWALAAMTAAEKGFPNPPSSSGVNSWLELAENVFNTQAPRWNISSCDGGLRWQIFPFNAGYDYKNAMSNGDFMQLAARLLHYTGNQTYADWALKASVWSFASKLIDVDTYAVYDGLSVQSCKDVNKVQWTANLGSYLTANVYMYNAVSNLHQNRSTLVVC
jgi:mannan endo-1,6-alpha-mannosidase